VSVVNVVGGSLSPAGSAALKSCLKARLGLWDLTFPQVVVRGTYCGGADDAIALADAGDLQALAGAARPAAAAKVPWNAPLAAKAARPDLLLVPRVRGAWYPAWPWYLPQFTMHANLMRYISILHLVIMGLALAVPSIRYPLLFFYTVDLSLFVLLGPSPWTPTGALATYFCWSIRGNATSTLAYKVRGRASL
jgi:hypothetical protein